MKKLTLFLLPVFLFQQSFAQKIHYEKSFQAALAKASAQNKLVFVKIFPPEHKELQTNSFVSGIDEPEVAEKFNASFINYQVSFTDTASNQFKRRFQTTFFPAYFFFDKNNNLVYRDDKNSSQAKKFLDMADAALKQFSDGKNLSYYDETYKKGNLSAAFLKEYIDKREQLGIYDNAKLIDQYVEFLPVNALNDYQTVLFILKAGPYAYGKTYTLANTNRKVYDSIYKAEPLAERIAINNRIISNSYKEAVVTKNTMLAQQVSNFSRSTFSKDYKQATIYSTKLMLQYCLAVKDTANYFRQANYFYDAFYMNITADSARKVEEAKRNEQLKILNSDKKIISADSMKKLMAKNGGKGTVVKQTFTSTSAAFNVANELNNAAFAYYTTGTVNPNNLSKAIIWSRRSILFNPVYGYYDTLAHLLYRYKFFAEAEVNQNIAVDLAKKQSSEDQVEMMKKELEKMKKRTL